AERQDGPRRVAGDQSRKREAVSLVHLERAPEAGDVARPVERRAEEPESVLERRGKEQRAQDREPGHSVREHPPDAAVLARVGEASGSPRRRYPGGCEGAGNDEEPG